MVKQPLFFQPAGNSTQVTVNEDKSDLIADWKRLSWAHVTIDDRPLEELMREASLSADALNESSLKQFFKHYLLKNLNESDQDEAVNYLMKTFHQEGLLHPISSAMHHLFFGTEFGPSPSKSSKQINLKTTSTGFQLQEIYTVNQFNLAPHASPELTARFPESVILPNRRHTFVIKSQATMDVEFPQKSRPLITVTSKSVSYGNTLIQSYMDQRDVLKKLIDKFDELLGLHPKKELPPSTEQTPRFKP